MGYVQNIMVVLKYHSKPAWEIWESFLEKWVSKLSFEGEIRVDLAKKKMSSVFLFIPFLFHFLFHPISVNGTTMFRWFIHLKNHPKTHWLKK